MEINETHYIEYLEAVEIHFELMWFYGETRIGVFEPGLIKSALARPRHAAEYENADIFRQAATLCYGLIKNHPWQGGNKRTATALTDSFLWRNGWNIDADLVEIIELSLKVEADEWQIDEIENWLKAHSTQVKE